MELVLIFASVAIATLASRFVPYRTRLTVSILADVLIVLYLLVIGKYLLALLAALLFAYLLYNLLHASRAENM